METVGNGFSLMVHDFIVEDSKHSVGEDVWIDWLCDFAQSRKLFIGTIDATRCYSSTLIHGISIDISWSVVAGSEVVCEVPTGCVGMINWNCTSDLSGSIGDYSCEMSNGASIYRYRISLNQIDITHVGESVLVIPACYWIIDNFFDGSSCGGIKRIQILTRSFETESVVAWVVVLLKSE
jgi:hypothetical protein